MENYDSELLNGVKSIKFTDRVKLKVPLPDSIEKITFNSYFDQEIPNGILPKKLKYLDLGWHFTNEINEDNIPESTEVIILGYWFNKDILLKRRNLKEIIVRDSYKCMVSSELLSIMPKSYQQYYDMILKNNIPSENYHFVNFNFFENDYDELHKKIMMVDDIITNEFKYSYLRLRDKNIFLNDKLQIVIDIKYVYQSNNNVIFVGNGNIFYRTLWRYIFINKPSRLYINEEIIGPFNIDEMIEHLNKCD